MLDDRFWFETPELTKAASDLLFTKNPSPGRDDPRVDLLVLQELVMIPRPAHRRLGRWGVLQILVR